MKEDTLVGYTLELTNKNKKVYLSEIKENKFTFDTDILKCIFAPKSKIKITYDFLKEQNKELDLNIIKITKRK